MDCAMLQVCRSTVEAVAVPDVAKKGVDHLQLESI